uniref:Cryptochrome/DNA photolyase FAD-binding domain-containing protein n=1 Tax=Gopherus evgoodei TaxID=1825980 RepID=A0A8C4YR62_9SAUR
MPDLCSSALLEGPSLCLPAPLKLFPWQGRTGYPFIDAIMTQLHTEGWIHHLARHAVAWQKVRHELLLDADWSLNAGNWQWLSASAFFHQFFRIYSPVAFGQKADRYLPFLRKFATEYIWKAPRSVQEQAGCVIGRDYPKPIMVHKVVSKRNVERMKAAYARRSASTMAQLEGGGGKKGNNPPSLTWSCSRGSGGVLALPLLLAKETFSCCTLSFIPLHLFSELSFDAGAFYAAPRPEAEFLFWKGHCHGVDQFICEFTLQHSGR